ncbi:hypothetical protein HD597_011271 [Nonomuraea thailandensis]|uniref:Uncharacterized protein n=1 Tax=Nonomuraea thailandensis TaxID=1188745 RepID=A0A9X2GSB2_9ACTN|nr:hypothetical protein [Nonomuraea thailandensis]MCP2364251.1 hypothetical protein [Nonomuraea thailandensis]
MIHPKPGQALPEPLAELQSAYPGWSIWTSRGDGDFAPRCYATRPGELTDYQLNHGLARTVQAETPDKLSLLLVRQTSIFRNLAGRGYAA